MEKERERERGEEGGEYNSGQLEGRETYSNHVELGCKSIHSHVHAIVCGVGSLVGYCDLYNISKKREKVMYIYCVSCVVLHDAARCCVVLRGAA